MSPKRASGTLALIGGGEWHDGCRDFDTELLARAGGDEVVVLPTAAAFEHADRVVERAAAYFSDLGAAVRGLPVLRRADAEDRTLAESVGDARFVYVADGSPLHLRSALKDSALFDAIVTAYRRGAVLAASGAGATVLCDPMVDPRGGASDGAGQCLIHGRLVVEGAVRLHVNQARAVAPGEGREGADLVDHVRLHLVRAGRDLPPAEAPEVEVAGVGAQRDPRLDRARHRKVHHHRVARVEAAGHVCRGDEPQQLLVGPHRPGAEGLAQVGVDVDAAGHRRRGYAARRPS